MKSKKPKPRWLKIARIAAYYDVHFSTVHGWIDDGVTVPSGEKVKLAARRVGRLKLVSRKALKAFFAECDGEKPAAKTPAAALADRDRRVAAALNKIDALMGRKPRHPANSFP